MGIYCNPKSSGRCGRRYGKAIMSSSGFSEVEALVVVALVGLMSVLAAPSLSQMGQNLAYREGAREILMSLRTARSLAVTMNREHRVEFDVDGRRFRLTRGDQASGSTNWDMVVTDWVAAPEGVLLMRNSDCGNGSDVSIHFNPNGTAGSQYVCVMDDNGAKRYRVGVPSSTTGRVKAEKWSGSNWTP